MDTLRQEKKIQNIISYFENTWKDTKPLAKIVFYNKTILPVDAWAPAALPIICMPIGPWQNKSGRAVTNWPEDFIFSSDLKM